MAMRNRGHAIRVLDKPAAHRYEITMKIEVLADPESVARRGAALVAAAARAAVAERGQFLFAVSGGHTPWQMLRFLAGEDMPWSKTHVFQVDERVAPPGDPDRNWTHLRESLLVNAPLPTNSLHAMPVEDDDLETAAKRYAAVLVALAGTPPTLDLVHLGLGPDGHTASLVPDDPVLDMTAADVGLTGIYMGRRRMTLTFPVLDRARAILWLTTGTDKADMLRRLRDGDRTIPAGRVNGARATLICDAAAAGT